MSQKTAIINVFVDPENGFTDLSLTEKQGGVLYVPQGEEVTGLMGQMIEASRGSIFIIGQDYHPANHISFMTNHPGVMEYRIEAFKKFLQQHGQPEQAQDDLRLQAQQPVHFFDGQAPALFPFHEIVLDETHNIIGVKEESGRIRKVKVETSSGFPPSDKDRGRVTKVLDEYHYKTFDQYRTEGRLLSTQTLWTTHCVQGTKSCLYPDDMQLPQGLKDKLAGDLMSPAVYHRDAATDNEFYVIRKGANSEVDSYGIGVENDGRTLTGAWDVFGEIANKLKSRGCENVSIHFGGLASNFCVEFSGNNIADFLAGHFKMRNMQTTISYVPEISRGIPIPGDAEVPFSLNGTEERLQKTRGIGVAKVADILAASTPPKKKLLRPQFPKA